MAALQTATHDFSTNLYFFKFQMAEIQSAIQNGDILIFYEIKIYDSYLDDLICKRIKAHGKNIEILSALLPYTAKSRKILITVRH